jgi:predicted ATPase
MPPWPKRRHTRRHAARSPCGGPAAYLRERTASQPLVVVLDDLHWADISSLRLLLFLARQLHDGSMLVIGTYRQVEVVLGEHPAGGLLAELAGQAGLMQLAGLTASEVSQLLNEVTPSRRRPTPAGSARPPR